MAPFYERYIKPLNRNQFSETIDTIGDNLQLLDFALKAMKVENVNLKPLADVLQNVATASKYVFTLFDTIKSKTGQGQGQGQIGYKHI